MAEQIWVETQDSGLVRADMLIRLGVIDIAGNRVTRAGRTASGASGGKFNLEGGLSTGEHVVIGTLGGTEVFDAMAEFITLVSTLVGTHRSSIVSLETDETANTWQWNIS